MTNGLKMDEIPENKAEIALFNTLSEKFPFPYLEWPLYITFTLHF